MTKLAVADGGRNAFACRAPSTAGLPLLSRATCSIGSRIAVSSSAPKPSPSAEWICSPAIRSSWIRSRCGSGMTPTTAALASATTRYGEMGEGCQAASLHGQLAIPLAAWHTDAPYGTSHPHSFCHRSPALSFSPAAFSPCTVSCAFHAASCKSCCTMWDTMWGTCKIAHAFPTFLSIRASGRCTLNGGKTAPFSGRVPSQGA